MNYLCLSLLLFSLLFTSCCSTRSKEDTTALPIMESSKRVDNKLASIPPPPPPKSAPMYDRSISYYAMLDTPTGAGPSAPISTTNKKKQVIPNTTLTNLYNNLSLGQIAFNIPNTLILGDTYKVNAYINRTITEDLVNKGYTIKDIKISSIMVLNLRGNPKDFRIEAVHNTEEQVILGTENTTWSWFITPLQKGSKELVLIASVRLQLPNKEETYDLPVMTYSTNVEIDIKKCSVHFIKQNSAAIIGSLLFPIIVWLIKRKFEKRGDKQNEQD